ncbi:MAG: hypothetical protein WA824_04095 [Candidatus Sulfotelmatobacter sp.]
MIVTKKVEGEVDYNDGEFAEVKTIGIGGIEEGLWSGTMQIHRASLRSKSLKIEPSIEACSNILSRTYAVASREVVNGFIEILKILAVYVDTAGLTTIDFRNQALSLIDTRMALYRSARPCFTPGL